MSSESNCPITDEDLNSCPSLFDAYDNKQQDEKWTSIVNISSSQQTVEVYRNVLPSGIAEFKTVATIPVSAELLFKIIMDLDYHKTWDSVLYIYTYI